MNNDQSLNYKLKKNLITILCIDSKQTSEFIMSFVLLISD